MKYKMLCLLTILSVSLFLLAGCGSKGADASAGTDNAATEENVPPEEASDTDTDISQEASSAEETGNEEVLDSDALIDAAMDDLGISLFDCSDIKVSISLTETATVHFVYDQTDYTYTLNKYTGEIISVDQSEVVSDGSDPGVQLSDNELMDAAFSAYGGSVSELDNIKIKLNDSGIATVSFTAPDGEYSYQIDVYTGEILDTVAP